MERAFLAYVRGRLRSLPVDHSVVVPIGDDSAVLSQIDSAIVCTDQIIDGVDFRLQEQPGDAIGYKSMAINVSDIAAMGGKPRFALVTMALPNPEPEKVAGEVYEGIIEAAREHSICIIGGDLSVYDGPLSISVTMIGEMYREGDAAWTRGGADENQAVYVTGAVGGSLLGRHLRPQSRIELVKAIRDSDIQVTAAIDISDGLSLDLDRLLAASGIGIRLEKENVPIHPDAHERSTITGHSAFRHAWSDGEDFELILAVSEEDADRIESRSWPADLTRIGTTTSRRGLWTTDENGDFVRLSPQGWLHGE